jgi:hypothetical protein
MKIKITQKYEVRMGDEVFECESLEQAERKLKSMRNSELECYMVRSEFENNELKEEYYVG